jgi:threonine synthase
MSHVNELGIKKVIQDSSGNAGCAIAAYAAKANIDCDIFLQADTSPGKIAQMKMYGANIIKVNGSREAAAAAAKAAAAANYYASHCYNPYFYHGTKTFAYEVCEQLNWQAPDAVVLPAGNGTLIIGCYIGFQDLLRAGYISNMPKLIAVQAANCAPLATAFTIGAISLAATTNTPTIAEGIAIAAPVRGAQMLHMVRETIGTFISVTEEEIKAAWLMCGKIGYYIEPTSAATIAGLIKYNEAYSDDTIVSLFSGHGLKSTEKVMKVM